MHTKITCYAFAPRPKNGPMTLRPGNPHWQINDLLHAERLGAGWLVLAGDEQSVYRVDGPAAEVLTRLTAGEPSLPGYLDTAVLALAGHGIIVACDQTVGVSRRTMLGAGVGIAVGLQALRLPVAAAAASAAAFTATGAASNNCLSSGMREIVFTASGTFEAIGGDIEATVILIGGGGGGVGYPDNGPFGAGGGGGAVVIEPVTITTDSAPEVTVGSGGSGVLGSSTSEGNGGASLAFGFTAEGGKRGTADGVGGASGTPLGGGAPSGSGGSGGGGGADGAGGDAPATPLQRGGAGGAGATITVGGVSTTVGGGGGGAINGTATAGGGTGGSGSSQGGSGGPGTGGGGGGGGLFILGGSGGSGRVIIRFADPTCPVP